MRGEQYKSAILTEKERIDNFLMSSNQEMYEYVTKEHPNSHYVLFYKYLTHSDLPTFGKALSKNKHDKNLLYYITQDDMKKVEEQTKKPFQTAKQSNIGITVDFYEKVGLPNPREVDPYSVNDYLEVELVNSSMEYFTSQYTQNVFNKLGKKPTNRNHWNFDSLDLTLSRGRFTSIDLHVAVHGIGMSQDKEFHKLRHHMFKSDTLILLAELSPDKSKRDKLFIIVEKNPAFYTVLGLANNKFKKYLDEIRKTRHLQATKKDNAVNVEDLEVEDEVTRAQQNAWRTMLAKEMMGYTQEDSQVFCPFTYVTANFENLGALFVASHIKGFKDSNTTNEEKYDINNGLLLCANADALFDKHLISINSEKNLVFSFLMDNDIQLKSKLLLMQPIFLPILNEKRMEYLAYHKKVFDNLEEERRQR